MILFKSHNKKSALKKQWKEQQQDLARLREQIEKSKQAILTAQNQFEHVIDPTLIDCNIYELNAAQLRYQFLLQNLKKRELQEV